jgi:Bacteriophage holin of superfamily 6 (Holin_LLH)
MPTNSTLNTLFLDLVPLLAALAAWLYQLASQRLPAQQRASLEQFAQIAANKIEQVFPNAGSANKKQLATSLVVDLFKSFHLPAPGARAIDAAIESSVLLINQAQSTSVPSVSSTTSVAKEQVPQ